LSGVGGARSSSRAFHPSQGLPLAALPNASAVALDVGALIVPIDAAARGLDRLGLLLSDADGRPVAGPGLVGEADIRSLLGLPDLQREDRAQATRRESTGDADVEVLGQQLSIPDLVDGGALSFGQLPLVALALVLLSSLLLVGAVLPPGVVARTPMRVSTFARIRQPLALAAIVILLPVAFVTLLAALS
jgi:hypothetical protein